MIWRFQPSPFQIVVTLLPPDNLEQFSKSFRMHLLFCGTTRPKSQSLFLRECKFVLRSLHSALMIDFWQLSVKITLSLFGILEMAQLSTPESLSFQLPLSLGVIRLMSLRTLNILHILLLQRTRQMSSLISLNSKSHKCNIS